MLLNSMTTVWKIARAIDDQASIAKALSCSAPQRAIRDEVAYETAMTMLEEALQIYRDLNDGNGIADTINNMGEVARHFGDFERAAECYDLSVRTADAVGNIHGANGGRMNQGFIAIKLKNYEAAP